LSFPFQQRRARGELLEANAKAERLAFKLKFREVQVVTEVDNALSALERAKERIQVAAQSLRLARRLLKGEQARFDLGATSLLFVNLRERNAVDAQALLIQARVDYEKAWAFYRWATGAWAGSPRGHNPSLGL
jgi:outer membrane protein TolC